jgi:phosphoribosylformylglycinamidine synthase
LENQELITLKTAQKLGLLPEEFDRIKKILGRSPNFTELSIFSVMWSEHCSYKNSIVWLKTLPKEGSHVLVKAGEENSGLIDIGDGLGCVFKIESHNHPSAIEPYHGASTGVGGVNRDIFTMGARPIAQLNSLRFGNLEIDRTKWIVKGVVKGIADYGNDFGVATVGGEVFFDECYQLNPLVNAMSVGIVKEGETALAISYGVGNLVYLVGASTGRDGVHGAASASKDISEKSAEDFFAVPVGNPLLQKSLMEASLEVIKTGAVIGMQDMGAAGIICSNSEMSAKGKHGMRIDLNKVPVSKEGMEPFEILLSESQERMLIVVKKDRQFEVEAIFEKWDINCDCIGEVTNTQRLEYYFDGELVADVPADDLVLGGGAPVYHRDYKEPAYFKEFKKFNIDDIAIPEDLRDVAQHLISHPNIASKRWVFDQYNAEVGGMNLTANRPCDAAVVSIEGTNKAIALTVDCNARYVNADPKVGTAIAVAEAARNITCAGGEPSAITNCLNFGNPYNPEVYWQFVEVIKGMSEACLRFNTPVTGGNVSFYNQSSDDNAIFPTPTIGMLGILEDVSIMMTIDFKAKDDYIYLIGESVNDIASSQYLASYHKIAASPAPYFDLDQEYNTHQMVKSLIKEKLIVSAHDISDGGLYIALLESAMPNNFGFAIETDLEIRKDAFLFGEAQGRIIVSVKPEKQQLFIEKMASSNTAFKYLGVVANSGNVVDDEMYDTTAHAKSIYDYVLQGHLGDA